MKADDGDVSDVSDVSEEDDGEDGEDAGDGGERSAEGLTLVKSTDIEADSDRQSGGSADTGTDASDTGSRSASAGGFADFGSSLSGDQAGGEDEEVCGIELHGRMAGVDDDEFEARLEAWVSEGAKHFRRS
jgi:hypothetical protein